MRIRPAICTNKNRLSHRRSASPRPLLSYAKYQDRNLEHVWEWGADYKSFSTGPILKSDLACAVTCAGLRHRWTTDFITEGSVRRVETFVEEFFSRARVRVRLMSAAPRNGQRAMMPLQYRNARNQTVGTPVQPPSTIYISICK